MFEITPILDHRIEKPLYLQIYDYVKEQIETKKITSGSRLPSKRRLADHLGVSVNTVENAFLQLIAEGYIESKPRQGLFVIDIDDHFFDANVTHQNKAPINKEMKIRSPYKYDFNQGHIDLTYFPYSLWKKLTLKCMQSGDKDLIFGSHPQGDPGLRTQISAYLYQSRGVICEPDQIVIGAGTQYLLSLFCRIIGKEWVGAMENPGFHRSRESFRSHGVKVIPVSVEDDGINIKALGEQRTNFVYVTPSHQFPMGGILPIQKRRKLLEWANRHDGYILEDDYDGEFRYKGKPIPSLQGLDQHNRVIYLGTFSKSFIPSIRLSYMVLPKPLMTMHREEFYFYKQTVSTIHQKALALFMSEGHWGKHLNKMRTLYKRKQKRLKTAIQEYLGSKVTMIGTDSGLHILLKVDSHHTEEDLIKKALQHSVKVYPTSIYFDKETRLQEDKPLILLGFGGLSGEEIEEGIKLLKTAWL